MSVQSLITLAVIAGAIFIDRRARRREREAFARLVVAEAIFTHAEILLADARAIAHEFIDTEQIT